MGPSLPVGKELREVSLVGSHFYMGFLVERPKVSVIPNMELAHFLNIPQENYEHLILYSLNCDLSKEFFPNLRGSVSMGYTIGINNLSSDFFNIDSDKRIRMGNTRGGNCKGGVIYSFSKMSLELGIKYHNPKFRITKEMERELLMYQQQTIYGKNLTFHEQRFNLSYLYLLISRKI